MKKKTSIANIIIIILVIIVVVFGLIILFNVVSAGGGDSAGSSDSGSPAASSETPGNAGETPAPADSTGSGNSQAGDSGTAGTDETDIASLIAALPDKEALEELQSLLSGYWIADTNFVGFVSSGGVVVIDYGLFQSSYGARGEIIDSRSVSPTEAELKIFIEAVPETAMNDAMPERTEIILIDISNFGDDRLNIKLEGLGGGEWLTYEYGGPSIEEAFS